MASALEVSGVWKRFRVYKERHDTLKEVILSRRRSVYEDFWALKDVSLVVEPGQTVGIIGENGSGKSTLLKVISKIFYPEKGSVTTTGRVASLLELGAGFHPDLTGRENIYLNGAILQLKRREIDEKIDEIIGFSGLADFIDTPIKNYSSGMYMRLGFAVATAVDPDILLTDEVLAVGDEAFQRQCFEKVYELRNRGKTILIVSHALDMIRDMTDRAVWIDRGQVRAEGLPHEVTERYLAEVNRRQSKGAAQDTKTKSRFGTRFGSRELEITDVRILDAAGKEKWVFKTGERLTISVAFQAHKRIPKPVFGAAIYAQDGRHVHGSSTKSYNAVPESVEGVGTVECTVESLPLLKGDYLVSVAFFDYACLHAFDNHHQMYKFSVVGGSEDDGMFHIPHIWRWNIE